MEIVISLVLIPLLVVAVCNLLGLKAKTTAAVATVVEIVFIVVVAFLVDLTPVFTGIAQWATETGKQLIGEVSSK